MEESLLQILSRYVSPKAAESLVRRAAGEEPPRTPEAWARVIEETLWPELARLLPFREMPPELRDLVRELKRLTPPEPEAREGPEGEEGLPEVVDLEDPAARQALAGRLARLEGVVGVAVAAGGGREERFAGEPVPLDPVHLLLQRQGYGVFYALLEGKVVALRPLARGYVALVARKESNLGQLLQALKRLVAPAEVGE
ncbi:hypothetical protein [Thermus thermamylovorans]|uniref:Uncharacterized protein n=1 Tax=Thermus thermamylovorans TaxID=2509362 RepID=A0A4Q9AZH5_9DEIN|nr:hypothetical protein [Thermus thermamylovorans]TBH17513.1 hypothetical protein ETP66_09005 [Thermus thermamylovorans]